MISGELRLLKNHKLDAFRYIAKHIFFSAFYTPQIPEKPAFAQANEMRFTICGCGWAGYLVPYERHTHEKFSA
jgi:hypothetical protein